VGVDWWGWPVEFGELVSVPLRQGWPHEGYDFTPWLVEHLEWLGRAIGLGLEFRAREHPVGRYALDILAADSSGRTVAIENQFGSTNHDHLGKLLTYVAGTDAKVIIWVAEVISPEHVAALEWINDHTGEDIAAYGVEVELLRIGDSPLAPNVRVVVRPNVVTKQTRPATAAQVAWSWDTYAAHLRIPAVRIEIARQLVSAVSEQIEANNLGWQAVFNKGFVTFRRTGGYKAMLVDLLWNGPVRLAVAIPAAPDELDLANPYPELDDRWAAGEREWGWTIKTLDQIPDVAAAVDIARTFAPASGPMAMPVPRPPTA
jgi:hypothetical protein